MRSPRFLARLSVAAAGLLLALAVPPARAASPELIAAAKAEGQVLWYTTLIVNQAVRPVVDAFQKAYPGITVQTVRAGSPDTVLRIVNEARAGRMQADLFDLVGDIGPLTAAGYVARSPDPAEAAIPAALRDTDGYWIAIVRNYMTLAYNTDMVPAAEAPRRLADLLDPKWKGKMGWTAEATVTGPPGFIGAVLDTMGEQAGMDYLRKLAAQGIVPIPTSQRGVLDQTISGERPIALMTYAHHSAISAAQGAPVDWSRFDPVVGSFIYLCLTNGAPHPNAARLLREFILSKQGQGVLAAAQYIPARDDVPPLDPGLVPEGHFPLRVLSPAEIGAKIPEWDRIYRTLFR